MAGLRGYTVPRFVASVLMVGLVGACVAPTLAADSDPLPRPVAGPRRAAIEAYNDGVVFMLARRYGEAQARFEAALRHDEALAAAHNNLAFSLRMQGLQFAELALRHYDRALALDPKLARALMYRGALHAQMRDIERARADLARLFRLDPALAARLAGVIDERESGDGYDGLAPQVD